MNTTYMCMYIYTCNLKIGHGIFQYHYIHVCIIVHPSVIMASTLSIWGYIYTCTCIRVLYTHICTYVQVVYVYICTYVQHTYLCTQSVGLYYEMYIHIHTYIYAHWIFDTLHVMYTYIRMYMHNVYGKILDLLWGVYIHVHIHIHNYVHTVYEKYLVAMSWYDRKKKSWHVPESVDLTATCMYIHVYTSQTLPYYCAYSTNYYKLHTHSHTRVQYTWHIPSIT